MEYVRMYTVLVIRRRGWNDWQVGEKGRSTQAGFLPKVDELNTLDSPARSIPQWPARRELEKEKREDVRKSEQPWYWYWHWQWKWAAIDGAGERQTGDESPDPPPPSYPTLSFLSQHWDSTQATKPQPCSRDWKIGASPGSGHSPSRNG
ncbi:hypothetical protein H0G86_003018 [Trichoderma simmonsii]|uniref:Uncharacterized protein n=1 Tax=Trichoderma simmonsii TaxID=1491479 RepID=A0A8G0PE06_9HYPO|nr:hypothetical protein H0G86_003018 [Trichoderma simmonsii]